MIDFVKPIANKDVTACQLLITDLKKHLPNNAASWEQPLISLVKGIEQNYHHETLLSILCELSPEIIEALFVRLLSSREFNSSSLKTLVDHINSISSEARSHQVTLIISILSSPVPLTDQPETLELILKLNAKEQGILLNQLRDQVNRCLSKRKEIAHHPHQKKLNQIYNDNLQQLLLLLTIHASKTEISLQIALSDDPILANLLMSKLLTATLSESKQKNLIINLFKNSKHYDWTDPLFNQIVQSKLIALVTNLPPAELKDLFNPYVRITRQLHHSVTNIIQFLDTLYSTTKNLSLIKHCLETADDADHSFTINFLTHSKILDRNLRQHCLKKIDIEQLVMLCGHIVALGQMGRDPGQELFIDYINVFCEQLKNLPHPQELIKQLVSNITFLPPNEESLAITTIITRLSTPEHKSLWLQDLILTYKNKTHLLPHCLTIIKENPDKFHFILPIIKNLNNEDLLTLYLLMVAMKVDKTAFYCFRELFKEVEKQPQLFYILSHTPLINHDVLHEFITQLNDKSLINLMDHLFSKTNPESEYKATLNQVLLAFCQRLYSDQNPNNPIHQWEKKPFTNTLVHYLLDNPECVCLLTGTYSAVYSWVTWSDPAAALKYRIDAVLNCLELEPSRINQIAVNWLAYFRTQPDQIQPLFNSLRSSESNRTTLGKKNLLGIKKACWELLKPGTSYKEEDFLSLVYNTKPELFAPVLPHLAQKEFLEQDPHLGSLWLAKTVSAVPKEMNDETLVILLTHSINESTLINWKKAVNWLNELAPEAQLVFAKKLINRAYSASNNPVLSQQTYLFITQYQSFSVLLPQLDPLHWYWIIQYSNQDQLIQHAPSWLDLIIQKHEVHSLNLGKILSLLPQNTQLIASLLKKQVFANPETFAQIFVQLSSEPECSIHFQSIHQFINGQDKTWIDHFLNTTISQIKTATLSTKAIHVLHSLVLNSATRLSSQRHEDKNLITNYLKLLNILIHQSDKSKHSLELKQLMLSFLNTFINCDFHWNQLIISEAAFTQTALTWIHNTDFKNLKQSIDDHPLINILTESQSTNLDPKLKNDVLFQKLLQTLLSNPPQKLKKSQFHLLFELLLPDNKTLLAQSILAKTVQLSAQSSEGHTQSLELLTNTLKPLELFKLFESQINPGLMARGLFTHQEGLKSLSTIQRTQLFDSINSSAHLLEILDGQTSLDIRYNFIKALFLIYGQNAKTLSQKLGQWLINPETLAALANFTIEKHHQYLLDEVLKEKPYYLDFLNDYLHHPTQEMPLNENSYLYHLARQNLLYPTETKTINGQFIHQLQPEEVLSFVKKQVPTDMLLKCLNSYGAVFIQTDNSLNLFIKTLNEILSKPQADKEIIPYLDANIINRVLAAAIKNPEQYSELLEKLVNSNWAELCLQQLQLELNRLIKQSKDPQPTCISQLSAEQLEAFPPAELAKILAIQRLLFFSKPTAELSSFATLTDKQSSSRERQLFCADASVYMALLTLEKNSTQPMKNSTLWLVQHGYEHVKNYEKIIDALFSGKEVNYPTAQYYWLCWQAFLREHAHQDTNSILPYGLIAWLSRLDGQQLHGSAELKRLVAHIARQQLLAITLKNVLEHSYPWVLNRSQITWLCEQSINIAPTDLALYPLIINLSSWSWLEHYMKNHTPQNFELLKAAIGNKEYLKDINDNEKNQLAFLSTLTQNKFTYKQILELTTTVQDDQVKSLLIVHLLSQEEYLASLKGESVLARLTNNEMHIPSRLNALVHQLDLKILTEALIDKLPPETAVSILCSVPHFHQLKEEQVDSLLKQCPQPEAVIIYWLNHYSTMPNAHCTLAHLMKLADAHITIELNKMDGVKKEAIITSMIEHLELFKPNLKVLNEQNEESRLIFAIRLFLNGHQHKTYVSYVNQLTEKLLSKNHQFSLEAIQLLMTLNEKQEFTQLNNKMAYLTNHYLRANALSGEIELFYNSGRVNIDSMTQLIQLHPVIPKAGAVTGFFTQLLGITSEVINEQSSWTIIPENPLIEKLPDNKKHISSFDYFLMHFKGDSSKISIAINDYLSFYAQEGCTRKRRKSVYQTCDLMIRPELDLTVREAIFASFLHYPDLYDKHIAYTMFLFDAQRTIQHFGLKGSEKNYHQVVDLCVCALEKLDPYEHQEIIKIATTAKAEAELELNFNEERGFFANLFRRLKRCWISGWTGFFSPNLPTYVAPASTSSDQNISPDTDQNTHIPHYKPEPNLPNLLKEIKPPFIQEQLDEFIQALNLFSLKANSRYEIETRQKVHTLFLEIREEGNANKKLGDWIGKNQSFFITNRFRLLELILAKDPKTAVGLLKDIKEENPQIQQIVTELTCSLPEPKNELILKPSIPPISKTSKLETTLATTLDTASELIQGAWSWTKGGIETFFKPGDKTGSKADIKAVAKAVTKADSKAVIQADTKVDSKAVIKADTKVDSKADTKADSEAGRKTSSTPSHDPSCLDAVTPLICN